jgi:hypothetical protein
MALATPALMALAIPALTLVTSPVLMRLTSPALMRLISLVPTPRGGSRARSNGVPSWPGRVL